MGFPAEKEAPGFAGVRASALNSWTGNQPSERSVGKFRRHFCIGLERQDGRSELPSLQERQGGRVRTSPSR
jgi:hypothetical protein